MSQSGQVESFSLWLMSMSQSDQLKLSEARLMSQSNRLVLLVVGVVVVGLYFDCAVFWPDLPINRVNSLLLINVRPNLAVRGL